MTVSEFIQLHSLGPIAAVLLGVVVGWIYANVNL